MSIAPQELRRIAREVAREMVAEMEVAQYREVSATEFARITGMSSERAVGLLEAEEVPMAYRTSGGQWRVPLRGIRLWQEQREKEAV